MNELTDTLHRMAGTGEPTAPLDLRTVPRAQWPDYDFQPLLLPPDVANYVDGMADGGGTQIEREGIEDRIASFYGITEPFFVAWEGSVAHLRHDA